MKIYHAIILLIMISIFYGSSCEKNCVDELYSFDIHVSTTQKDTFYLGDTLWVESHIDSMAFDTMKNKFINVADYPFITSSIMIRYDSIGHYTNVAHETETINRIGETELVYRGPFSMLYNYYNKDRNLKFGLVCNQPGVYEISHTTLFEHYMEAKIIKNGCYQRLVPKVITNHASDENHYEYISSYYVNSDPPYTKDGFNQSGSYAFIVK